jgi:serine/threonine-protein kinase RsbW
MEELVIMDQSSEISIGSDIAEIPEISARLETAMRLHGFSDEDILDTQLAVEEAITNVIVHGYNGPGEIITVSIQASPNRVEIQITDSAPRFDPLSLPEPDLDSDVEDRQIGGLGVYLIRQVMDEISYRYEKGNNILVLIKKRVS